jgi:ZIP Zinc transporter
MELTTLQSKIVYTMIVATCDCLFLLIPFLWHAPGNDDTAQKIHVLNGLTSFLGGALLSLAFVNLMPDSNTQMQKMMPSFPMSYVSTVIGILFTAFLPRLFVFSIPKTSAKHHLLEKVNDNEYELFELTQTVTLDSMSSRDFTTENNSKSDNISESLQTNTTITALFFVGMSLFESFTGNISIGVQSDATHLMMLAILIIIGDSVQMIAIGLQFRQLLLDRHLKHRTLLHIYAPTLILFFFVVAFNLIGTFVGILFSFMLNSPINQWWLSECMLAFNAGMFIKMSIVDMIEFELNKKNITFVQTIKQMTAILLGASFGVAISIVVAPHS